MGRGQVVRLSPFHRQPWGLKVLSWYIFFITLDWPSCVFHLPREALLCRLKSNPIHSSASFPNNGPVNSQFRSVPFLFILTLADTVQFLGFKCPHVCSSLNGCELTPGDGEGPGCLVCYSPWDRKESDATERLKSSSRCSPPTVSD